MTKQKTDVQKADELKRLKAWLVKVLPDDHDKYDLTAKYDPAITYAENKTAMREELKSVINDLKSQVEHHHAEQERMDNARISGAEREVDEYNQKLTADEDIRGLEEFYKPIRRGVKKMCLGYSNLLFVKSRGGVGKSYQIRRALIENHADYVEIAGDVTEAYLYRLIYENNGKILWFKDVVKLLQNLGSMNLLKGATETEVEKVLTKSNYSKDQDDLPDRFLCRAKFIFDYNNLYGTQLAADFEALTSRGDYNDLPFSDDDMKRLMLLIAVEDWQKEVTRFVIENFEATGMVRLNLRTQWKAFQTYKFSKATGLEWEDELSGELKRMSRTRSMLYTLIGNKAVKTAELKKLLLRQEILQTLRSADRKINEWLYLEDIWKVSEEEKNFYVCINPKR